MWEVIARLQELDGSEEHRIKLLEAESDLHPRLIRIALDYAANLPVGGAQAPALAKRLARWAQDHPDPYLGAHWRAVT